jgi:hypothetical protein
MLRRLLQLLLITALLGAQLAPAVAANGIANGAASGDGGGGSNGNGNGNSGNNGNGDANGAANGNAGGNGNGNAFGRDKDAPATLPPPAALISEQDAALDAVKDGRALPLETILGVAKSATPGEVLDARLVTVNGFLLYELKILAPNGYSVSKAYYYARSGKQVR